MRLIDADVLEQELSEMYKRSDKEGRIEAQENRAIVSAGISCGLAIAKMVISKSPTIESEPVKHGTWEEVEFGQIFRCSNCHDGYTEYGVDKYCYNCGAKMDGGNKDG